MESKEKDDKTSEEDSRTPCKYGSDCYQKNPDHHKKYKHPDSNKEKPDKEANSSKKRKGPENSAESSSDAEEPKAKKPSVSPSSKEDEDEPASEQVQDKDEPASEQVQDKAAENLADNGSVKEETKQEDKAPEKLADKTPEKPVKKLPEQVSNDKAKTENIVKKDEDPYADTRKLILKFFRVPMPVDFYKFYDFCNELKPSDPSTAFKIADIKLVGPYDILNGLITKSTPDAKDFLTHWRYFYDPPEFQTILKGNDKEGLHFGYWRDRPSSEPAFVATNCSNVSHKIKPVAENVFGAVANYLEEKAKKANPFEKTGYFNLLGKIKAYAKKFNIPLETQTPKMKSREKNVVARTIHGAGIVCPYNKKTQLGYRELSVTDNQLLKIVKKIDDAKTEEDRAAARVELDEVVRLATIAGDECDFGTCLELGHDLLSTGCIHVQNAALDVLSIAYNQLDRQLFLEIVEAHMKNRKKGINTSALPNASKECTKFF